MKRLGALFISLLLVLSISGVAEAAKNYYTIGVEATSTEATFTVTREFADDNNPVVWVMTDCEIPQSYYAAPVIWGMWYSVVGTVTLPVGGSYCTAWVTTQPWKSKVTNTSITFNVPGV